MPTAPTRFDPKRTGNEYLEYYAPHKVVHPGIDLNWGYGNDDEGQVVVSPSDAVVEFVSKSGENGGLGLYAVLYHPKEKLWSRYLHLQSVRKGLKAGVQLKEGEAFAAIGRSGTTSAHLHFEVLNQKGIDWIKKHWREYGKYPSGLSHNEVSAMFLNPTDFLAGKFTPNAPAPSFASNFYKLNPLAAARRAMRRLRHQTNCPIEQASK